MDQSSKETLKKAINALKAGDTKTAIPLLTGVLKKEPELEQGWYLLGMALEDKDKKLRAFRQVLNLNPNHTKAQQQIEKLEQSETPTAPPPQREAPTSAPPAPEPAQPQNGPFGSPFSEPNDQEPETPEPAGTMQPDFELPDWMKQDSFDATDQLPPIPEAFRDGEDSSEFSPWEEDQQEEAEVPDWAKAPGPPRMGPDLSERQEEPEEEEEPDWMQSSASEEPEQPRVQPAFTGYYLDDDESKEEGDTEEGEEDIEEGEPEWLRSMVEEDEEDGKKKKKKKKKRKKKEKRPLTPAEKKQRRRRIILVLLVLIFGGLGAAGYFYQDELKPYIDPFKQTYLPPVWTQIAPVTDLLTEGAPLTDLLTPNSPAEQAGPTATEILQPTMAPTWTPANNQGSTAESQPDATRVPEFTATPTSTSLPLPEDVQNEIKLIQEQVLAIRELPGPTTVEDDITPKLKLRQIMEGWIMEEGYLEELQKDQIVLRAFGLVNSSYDMVEAALNSRADAIGGFYLPEANRVHVIGTDFTGIQKYVYAHEYAHAIQDANFDLTGLGVYPTCTQAAQTCLAIQSLVEGEASLVDSRWFETYPPEIGSQDIRNYAPPSTLFQNSPAPEYFSMNSLFPYTYGLEFVTYLYENGGWNAVNRAYRVLPVTTEQILHPEKYDQREAAMYLEHPDLSSVFDENWEMIRNDSLGEWENYLLLAHNDYANAKQPESEAAIAAAGWGADEYQVYYNATTQEVMMSVYWTWDSVADASEFYDMLITYQESRFANFEVDGPGNGRCWSLNGETSCIYRNGKQMIWLFSDNLEILESVKQRFSYFE